MLYMLSLLPIVAYLLIIKAMDGFALAKWQKISVFVLYGLAVCSGLFFMSDILEWKEEWVSPLLEEVLKAFLLVVLITRKKVVFLAEALIYGAAVGAGFAFLENVLYIYYNADMGVGDSVLRGFATALLHIGCTSLCASLALLVARFKSAHSQAFAFPMFVMCFVPSFLVHWFYNTLDINGYLLMIYVIAGFLLLFMGIYRLDEMMIRKWMDNCINNDIALYSAIKEGKIASTPAGFYLENIKERFDPELFFDVCMYVSLYLELSIQVKSHMMMREAGVDIEPDPETRRNNKNNLIELKTLSKRIGPMGLVLLSPVIHVKDEDRWAMEEFLN